MEASAIISIPRPADFYNIVTGGGHYKKMQKRRQNFIF
jgi:hypothetical protein